jgi:hypothetical protein
MFNISWGLVDTSFNPLNSYLCLKKMPPRPTMNKDTPDSAAPPETMEEKARKAHECQAERRCREASAEHWEEEEIARMEKLATEEKAAKEREEKARVEAVQKAAEEKEAEEQAEVARKAMEAKKAEGLKKGKGPAEAVGSTKKVS